MPIAINELVAGAAAPSSGKRITSGSGVMVAQAQAAVAHVTATSPHGAGTVGMQILAATTQAAAQAAIGASGTSINDVLAYGGI